MGMYLMMLNILMTMPIFLSPSPSVGFAHPFGTSLRLSCALRAGPAWRARGASSRSAVTRRKS